MKKTIRALIVDDDDEICTLLCNDLADFGITAHGVGDGTAMHLAMTSAHFDIVILDLMLLGEDGPDLWFIVTLQFIAFSMVSWFGAKMLARPIQQLAQAAPHLGNTLNHPALEEKGSIEARQAARVFNQMQERLRAQIEERAHFLAAVSHDLRTPLARMKLRTERMLELPAKEKFRSDIIEMATMLDATLEYLRDQTQSEAWTLLDTQALMHAASENTEECGHHIAVTGTAQPLLTQPLALRRCLSNLLENALRYGKQAYISLKDDDDFLIISIRDQGPGIPEDKMRIVFEPFVRLESSRNKAFGGVGLGLSIARDAARVCGGTLTLCNAEEGGLIANISLPRHRCI